MQNSSRYINWINALKALSIVFVFFAHAQYYYHCRLPFLNRFINPWYVNAFFFLSGYLLFWKQLSEPRINEDSKKFVVTGSGRTLFFNIVFRIIIPSILFSIIELVPSSLIQNRSLSVGYALQKTLGGGTYWFTSALAVAELIILALLCTRKRSVWFYAILCLLLSGIGLLIVRFGILPGGFWAWRHGLLALVFLAMGGVYWRYEKKIDQLMNSWFILVLLGAYVALCLCFKSSSTLISTLKIQPIGYLTSLIACLLMVWLCKRLPEMKILTFIGKNSLGFYLVSGALPVILCFIANKVVAGRPVWTMLVIWLTSLFLAYGVVWLMNKWAPWLLDLRRKRG